MQSKCNLGEKLQFPIFRLAFKTRPTKPVLRVIDVYTSCFCMEYLWPLSTSMCRCGGVRLVCLQCWPTMYLLGFPYFYGVRLVCLQCWPTMYLLGFPYFYDVKNARTSLMVDTENLAALTLASINFGESLAKTYWQILNLVRWPHVHCTIMQRLIIINIGEVLIWRFPN